MHESNKALRMALFVGVMLVGMLGSGPDAIALKVGDKAPDFTLKATTGQTISLSQFRGKKIVVLEFYGADFSPV